MFRKAFQTTTQGDPIYTAIKDTDFPALCRGITNLSPQQAMDRSLGGVAYKESPLEFAISKMANKVQAMLYGGASLSSDNIPRQIGVLYMMYLHCQKTGGDFQAGFERLVYKQIVEKKANITNPHEVADFISNLVSNATFHMNKFNFTLPGFKFTEQKQCIVAPSHTAKFVLITDFGPNNICSLESTEIISTQPETREVATSTSLDDSEPPITSTTTHAAAPQEQEHHETEALGINNPH